MDIEAILNILFNLCAVSGALAFAFNLLPQLCNSLRRKSTGLSNGFFVLALVGNIGSAAGVFWNNVHTGVWQWNLYGNYAVATMFTVWLLVLKIKYKG